jgi:hypothetical protein
MRYSVKRIGANDMRVYGFTEQEVGFMEIENSLKAEQKFVGGLIELIGLTEELDLICNEEGKINGLPPQAVWLDNGELVDIICGNCFVCRHDDEGNFTDIMESDEEHIRELLKAVVLVGENRLMAR